MLAALNRSDSFRRTVGDVTGASKIEKKRHRYAEDVEIRIATADRMLAAVVDVGAPIVAQLLLQAGEEPVADEIFLGRIVKKFVRKIDVQLPVLRSQRVLQFQFWT